MNFLWGFKPEEDSWVSGKVLDPESGEVYPATFGWTMQILCESGVMQGHSIYSIDRRRGSVTEFQKKKYLLVHGKPSMTIGTK